MKRDFSSKLHAHYSSKSRNLSNNKVGGGSAQRFIKSHGVSAWKSIVDSTLGTKKVPDPKDKQEIKEVNFQLAQKGTLWIVRLHRDL